MDIKRCYEILELDPDASPDEAKQSYKDLVNIWHPDRVSNNPRLKQKAEEKLKEVNLAYEEVEAFLSSKQNLGPEQKEAPQASAQAKPETGTGARAKPEADYYERAHAESETRDKTEAAVEAGTGIVESVCSKLYKSLRRFIAGQAQRAGTEMGTKAKQGEPKVRERQSRGYGRGKGRGRGMGRGRGRQ